MRNPILDNPGLVGGVGLVVFGLTIWIGRAFMPGGIRPLDIIVGAVCLAGGWYLLRHSEI